MKRDRSDLSVKEMEKYFDYVAHLHTIYQQEPYGKVSEIHLNAETYEIWNK